jgi:predicted ArsR family transcriptional regulator
MIDHEHVLNGRDASERWWHDVDDDILRCLAPGHVMTAKEIADKIGVSESAAASFLALLALDNKVHIVTVEAVRPSALRSP